MNKKILILIIIIFLIIFSGILYFYFSISKNGASTLDNQQEPKSFFPFGQPSVSSTTNQGGVATTTNPTTDIKAAAAFQQISDTPIAGAVAMNLGTASSSQLIVRYIERSTGHIYDVDMSTQEKNRVSNTTIPKIYQAIFSSKGDSAILRYLKSDDDTINNFFIKIATTTSTTSPEQKIQGVVLPVNADNFSFNSKQDKVFYLTHSQNGSTGRVFNVSTQKSVDIFTTSINEWLVSWPKDEILSLTTKPYSKSPGIIYSVDPKSGTLNKVLGDILGLTTLTSPDAKNILFSNSVNGDVNTHIFNVKSGSLIDVSLNTLPEKCVWSKKDLNTIFCAIPIFFPSEYSYPDSWYKGVVSFTDNIWKINVNTGTVEKILSVKDYTNTPIDMINPSLSEKEDYLLVTNKNDLTLWGLKLK